MTKMTEYNLTLAGNTYTSTNIRYLKELKFIQVICAAFGADKVDRIQAFELYDSVVSDPWKITASDEGGIISGLCRDGLLRKFTSSNSIDTGKKTKREKSVIQFVLDFSDDVKNSEWCLRRIKTNHSKNALAAKNHKLRRKLAVAGQNLQQKQQIPVIETQPATQNLIIGPVSNGVQKEFRFPAEVVDLAKNIFIERLRSMPMREFAALFGF